MKKLDLGENDFDDEVAIDFDDALANNTALNTLTRGGADFRTEFGMLFQCPWTSLVLKRLTPQARKLNS